MPSRLAISSADSPEPRRNALSRLPISSKRTGIGERSVGQIVCRALGLPPPPLWGRDGEGGNNKFGACCYPPPCPSPTGGEGTLRRCMSAAVSAVLVAAFTAAASAQTPPAP